MEVIKKQNKLLFEGFSIFSLLILLAVIVIAAFNTDSPLIYVLIGFLPTLITIILSIVVYEDAAHSRLILWFTPLLVSGAFFAIGTNYEYMKHNMDIPTLTTLNIIFSLLYLTVFFTIIKIGTTNKKKPKKIKEENIQEYIASIEEKSKALNFVIGRIYNKYHGGTPELRQTINFKPEWYNELSEALQNESEENKEKTKKIMKKIEQQLILLEKPEEEVFSKEQIKKLKNLKRNKDGKTKILETLKNNDADPVELYFEGMKEFCDTIKKEIK